MPTHYQTLRVSDSATAAEIKQAYRKQASQYHPDRGGDIEKFKAIQTAYDVIGNQAQRERYDQTLALQNAAGDAFDWTRQFRSSSAAKNKDIRTQIFVSLEELLTHQNKIISIKTSSGQRQTVTVEIPLGTNGGSTIKYAGLGDNFFANLPRGDLYVHIQLDPHPIFDVKDFNLFTSVDIDAIDAILGTKRTIKTLDYKEYELTIPPGTQGDTKFKIANQGLYTKDAQIRGNLYVAVRIKIPTNLTPYQTETLTNLFKNDLAN